MNALFATQALGLRFLDRLRGRLEGPLGLVRSGFFVSDSSFYQRYLAEQSGFPGSAAGVVKEWEIIDAARRAQLDRAWLQATEQRLGGGPLWDALVCDRRIMLGPWCKERQDYQPRFDHDQMLRILQVAVSALETLFDTVRPDVTFGFVPVTFGEYLCYQIASSRGIPQLYLYPTKIENYMAWMTSFFGRPDHIVEAYETYERTGERDAAVQKAERYVRQTVTGLVRHEGMILVPRKRRPGTRRGTRLDALTRLARAEVRYWGSESRDDNHLQSPTLSLWHRRVLGPGRTRAVTRRLRRHYARVAELEKLEFAFHPLHAEPEVALSIHGKPYVNQIEMVRNVARSLPAGMRLVVKEHPRCIGYRPASYYAKLLQVPNVTLADPETESKVLIRLARIVTTVWSFVGFESVLFRTPVITFGTPLYGILPESMIRRVSDLNRLHAEIRDLMDTFEYNEGSVVHFVAACMRGGVPIDFYARFIDKAGRHVDDDGSDDAEQFGRFVRYTIQRVREVVDDRQAYETRVR